MPKHVQKPTPKPTTEGRGMPRAVQEEGDRGLSPSDLAKLVAAKLKGAEVGGTPEPTPGPSHEGMGPSHEVSALSGLSTLTDLPDPALSASTSTKIYGGRIPIGTVNNYGETGNSSTNRTAPGSGPALPIEILRMDREAVELYKTALEEGEVVDHSIRIMIIGHFGVGKTTLARRLLGKPVDIQARDITDGIDVHICRCKVSLSDMTWHSLQPDEKSDTALKRLAKVIASRSTGEEDAPTPPKKNTTTTEIYVLPVGGAEQIGDVQGEKLETQSINKPSDDMEEEEEDEDTVCIEEMKALVAEMTETDTFEPEEFASVSLWDFAGQAVFYTTHQMFLSPRAVYLLVTDISKHIGDVVIEDECYFDSSGPKHCTISELVDFWLNSIHTCSPDGPGDESTVPPVILVGTHADELTEATVTDDADFCQRGENCYRDKLASAYFEAVRNHLCEKPTRFHLADEDFDIDNTVIDSKLEDLKKKIVEVAQQQPHWGQRIPAKWLRLETALCGLKEKGLKIVDFVLIEELNRAMSVPISTPEELELFLQFHHQSGNILYFSEGSLKEKVVLDSQWLVDALKSLITAKIFCLKKPHVIGNWREFYEHGILRPQLLDAVWQKKSFHDNRAHLLALMEKMNLISRPMLWHKDDAKPTKEEYHLAPCMLKDKPPEDLLYPSHGEDCKTTSILVFYFQSKFVPTAIFHRLIAACLSNWSLWRQGKSDLIFCGCGVFKIDQSHKLTLVFRDFTIQAFVTKFGRLEKSPREEICIAVLDFLDKSLKSVTGCIATSSLYTLCIKCPENKSNSVDAIIPVSKLQEGKEVVCSCHDSTDSHVINSVDMLKYWFPCKPDSVTAPLNPDYPIDPQAGLIPQQTPREPLPSNQPTQNQEASSPEYSMTRKPRGICVIINNKDFGKDKKTREWTDVDKKRLENIFKKLDFIVQIHDDLTDTKMMETLIEAKNIDHTNFDCFVCCILTHGDIGHLFGSNGNPVSIKELTSTFQANRCPSLAGKPKLFFFQACQGRVGMERAKIETDDIQERVETDGKMDYVPNEADFLLGYATVPGYLSFRNTTHGSWYITKLVQMLDEHSHNQDLMSILVKVNAEVSCVETNEGPIFKQIPAPWVTLRKKLYFR